jgi:ferrous iron transport protein B
MKKITVALAGNPNSGKTTVFNNLTGARQKVGNYPGVTVEKKSGTLRRGDTEIHLVDLPGTYSLSARSIEEIVASNFILDEKPDVVVDIVDASNLERNLYLAVQLVELGIPLVLAFNVMDEAREHGLEFDLEKLSRYLGAPIVPTVGHKGEGMEDLLDAVLAMAGNGESRQWVSINYGAKIENELAHIEEGLSENGLAMDGRSHRWIALKLLEEEQTIQEKMETSPVAEEARKSVARLESELGRHPEPVITEHRYHFISRLCQIAVRSKKDVRRRFTERVDTVVLNRVAAIPIFLCLMYLVFQCTFAVGEAPMGWIEGFFGWMGGAVSGLWPEGSESALRSLLVDGVIGGVGGVLVFLPNILLLFLFIALLEDSGYMARAAFIMDRLMTKVGLPGKSFIPLLTGFGCSVPAIMATRTLESERDRLTTMLVTPLMSCGARLPIYVLIIPAFFPKNLYAPVLWSVYIIGIVLAVVLAKLLRSTLFKGPATPLVMEMPPYRFPTLKGLLIHMWERARLYVKKAGGLILAISVVMWALTSYPKPGPSPEAQERTARGDPVAAEMVDENTRRAEELSFSVAGRVGHAIEPVLRPLGFDWKIGTALIGAFAAKEMFVAQMGIVYSLGEGDEKSQALREKLQQRYSPLTALCILLFCLISAPCMATIVMTRKESRSWKWAFLQLGGLTAIAYGLTVAVYQLGKLLGIGVL